MAKDSDDPELSESISVITLIVYLLHRPIQWKGVNEEVGGRLRVPAKSQIDITDGDLFTDTGIHKPE